MSENIMKALIFSFSIFKEPVRNSPTSAAAKYTTFLAMYLSMSQERLKKEAAILIFQKSIQKLFRFIYLGYHNYRAQLSLAVRFLKTSWKVVIWVFIFPFGVPHCNCTKDKKSTHFPNGFQKQKSPFLLGGLYKIYTTGKLHWSLDVSGLCCADVAV